MNPVAIAAAAGAALVGALIWAVVAVLTGYEIGWIAWGVGGLVGLAANRFGSEGAAMGVTCAALALAGIFLGKVVAVNYMINSYANEAREFSLSEDVYNADLQEAAAFAAIEPHQYRQYMINFEYTDASTADAVSDEELDWFTTEQAPFLLAMNEASPSYEEWRQMREADIEAFQADATGMSFGLAFQGLGLMDILFAALGVGTAYRLAAGTEEEQAA